MTVGKFSDECEGCLPALWDTQTQRRLGPETPEMKAIMAVWGETTKQEREAFHRVTCLNSRTPSDMRLVGGLNEQFRQALGRVRA